MPYKIFLSHSTEDKGLVISLAKLLTKFGVEVFVAEWYLTPGESIDKEVFNQINMADCIVVLLTKNGIRSNWVQQEVGYALRANKPVIPIVEKGTPRKDLAALQSKKYIEYDPLKPQKALTETSSYIQSLTLKKEEKLKKDDLEKALIVAGGITAFILLLSTLSGEKK